MATKKCAFCAEEIQEEAVKCKHCQSSLTDKTGLPAAIKAAKSPAKLSIVLFASSLLLGIGFILGRSTYVEPPVANVAPKWSYDQMMLTVMSPGGLCHPSAAILGAHSPHKAVEYYQVFQAHNEAKLQELANTPQDFDPLTVDDELTKTDDETIEEIPILKVYVKTGAQAGKTLYVAVPLLEEGSKF